MNARFIDVGDDEKLAVLEVSSGRPGPCLAILGGVHGDEWEGIVTARMFAVALQGKVKVLRGNIRLVAVANPPAHRMMSRVSPADGCNLARSFPGRADGTISERIAHALTTEIISGADLLIDLHSAGSHYEMPVFVGYSAQAPTGDRSAAAAHAFGAPNIWRHEEIAPGRSLSAALDLGVPAIYVEGSGGGGLRGEDLDIYLTGLIRLLGFLGMTDTVPQPPGPALIINEGNGDVDSSLSCTRSGLCITRVRAGELIDAGAVLAEIIDDQGHRVEQIRSQRAAHVMMLRRTAVVQAGDGIAMLAPSSQPMTGTSA